MGLPLSFGGGGHHFSNLVGGGDQATGDAGHLRVTWHHNWWADNVVERQPRVRFGQNHLYNNLWTSNGDNYCVGVGFNSNVLTENNVFIERRGSDQQHRLFERRQHRGLAQQHLHEHQRHDREQRHRRVHATVHIHSGRRVRRAGRRAGVGGAEVTPAATASAHAAFPFEVRLAVVSCASDLLRRASACSAMSSRTVGDAPFVSLSLNRSPVESIK